jgi:flavin reductase (DIM6/NTAB) family NADH-FMN oxidoreductase RutF
MQQYADNEQAVAIELDKPIWDQFFTIAPLIVVGSREKGGYDLAPKHMATPLGWQNYYCFVCSPSHATQQNIEATGEFTVSYPRPGQIVQASMAAAARTAEGHKPSLAALETFSAQTVDGVLLKDAYLWLECKLERIIGNFGSNSLIIGEVVDAGIDAQAMRKFEQDDAELINRYPLLAYINPGRFAEVKENRSFPFPVNFKI